MPQPLFTQVEEWAGSLCNPQKDSREAEPCQVTLKVARSCPSMPQLTLQLYIFKLKRAGIAARPWEGLARS